MGNKVEPQKPEEPEDPEVKKAEEQKEWLEEHKQNVLDDDEPEESEDKFETEVYVWRRPFFGRDGYKQFQIKREGWEQTTATFYVEKGILIINIAENRRVIRLKHFDIENASIREKMLDFQDIRIRPARQAIPGNENWSVFYIPRGKKCLDNFDGAAAYDHDLWFYLKNHPLSVWVKRMRECKHLVKILWKNTGDLERIDHHHRWIL